jgi:hypothetical protein
MFYKSNFNSKNKDPINDYIINLGNDMHILTNCIPELYILNKIEKIPIVVYDDDNVLIYVFEESKGLIYNYSEKAKNKGPEKEQEKDPAITKILENKTKNITLRFEFISNKSIPDDIEVFYYK